MPNLTVGKMMSISPFDEAQVIAGREGLSNQIEYMGVLDAPDSIQFVKQNEFVMSSGFIFSNNTSLAVEIISELCKRRAAGLGIKIFRYINSLSDEALRMANQNNLPILFIPNKYSWYELISPFMQQSIIFDQQESFFLNIKIYDRLVEKLSQSKSYYDALSQAASILGIPCALLDANDMSMLFYPQNFNHDFKLNKNVFIDIDKNDLNNNVDSREIYFSGHACTPQSNILFSPFEIDHYTHIVFFECTPQEDFRQLKHLIYAMMLVKNFLLLKYSEQQDLLHKISTMVEKSIIIQELTLSTFLEQANHSGIKMHSDYFTVVCSYKNHVSKSTDILKSLTNLSSFYKILGDLYDNDDILSCFGTSGKLFFLIPLKKPLVNMLKIIQHTRKQVAQIKSTLSGCGQDFIFSFGIGNMTALSNEFIESVNEAEDALRIGSALLGNDQITHVRDINIYRLLVTHSSDKYLNKFLESYFSPMVSLDKKTYDKLFVTLNAYIESYYNARECGRNLGLHYNTIRYRLEQIFTLTGLDPFNHEDLYILQTCFYIMKLLKVDQKNE